MNTDVNMENLKKDGREIFNSGFACSEAVIYTFRKHFDVDISDEVIAMSSGFPWGIGGKGCICGALAAAVMCLGYLYGRKVPGDPALNNCLKLTGKMHDRFVESNRGVCCRFLTRGFDMYSKERKEHCTCMVENTLEDLAKIVLEEESTLK